MSLMTKKRQIQTKLDSLYTTRKDLIIKVDRVAYIREIIRTGSALQIDWACLDLSGMCAHKMRFYYQSAEYANLTNGSYQNSRFGKSIFTGSDCSESDFTNCSFQMGIFSDSKFINSCLKGADLRQAFFLNVDFSEADLTKADLRGCRVVGSKFNRTDLRGANIEGVEFTDCEMDFIKIDMQQKNELMNLS